MLGEFEENKRNLSYTRGIEGRGESMKPIETPELKAHILFCVNDREAPKVCCKKLGGEDLFYRFKKRVKSLGLSKILWVSRTRCLGYCNASGGVVAIHRPGQSPECYTEVLEEDFETIWQSVTNGVDLPDSPA